VAAVLVCFSHLLLIGHFQPESPPLHLSRVQPLAENQEVLLELLNHTLEQTVSLSI
jgi:hypothetical protein